MDSIILSRIRHRWYQQAQVQMKNEVLAGHNWSEPRAGTKHRHRELMFLSSSVWVPLPSTRCCQWCGISGHLWNALADWDPAHKISVRQHYDQGWDGFSEYLKPENISNDGKVASPHRKAEALYAEVHSDLNVSHTRQVIWLLPKITSTGPRLVTVI